MIVRSSYEIALEAFIRSSGVLVETNDKGSHRPLSERLESLKPLVRELRVGFKDAVVDVDYGSAYCEAYLLAYFAPHAMLAHDVLTAAPPDRLPKGSQLRACALGGGPGPELRSLQAFIAGNPLSVQRGRSRKLDVLIIDRKWNQWRPITQAVAEVISDDQPNVMIELDGIEFELTDPAWLIPAAEFLASADVLVLQNLLNEFPGEKWSDFESVLASAVEMLRPGSLVAIADRQFDPAARRIASLRRALGELATTHHFQAHSIAIESPPRFLRQHLLNGADGLIPRKSVKFSALLLERI